MSALKVSLPWLIIFLALGECTAALAKGTPIVYWDTGIPPATDRPLEVEPVVNETDGTFELCL